VRGTGIKFALNADGTLDIAAPHSQKPSAQAVNITCHNQPRTLAL
jgi:hypothetical protein